MTLMPEKRPFPFQPLLFASLGFFLVALFFVTALMDARRTQNTLMNVFQNKGLTIIETVETIAGEKYKGLMGTTRQSQVFSQDFDRMDEGFRMQELILGRLIELARNVDRRGDAIGLSSEDLNQLAAQAGMQAVAVYDEAGRAVRQSAPVPETVDAAIRQLIESGDEIAVDFDGKSAGPESSYLVAVRRKSQKGAIGLIFRAEGFRLWAEKVAIQSAIEESGWRKGVQYFMVVDSSGVLSAAAGGLPEAWADEPSPTMAARIPMKYPGTGRRLVSSSPELLEVYTPFAVNGRQAGIAIVGLEIEEAVRLRETHQQRIAITTGIMMLGAVLVMFLFYRLQRRHLRRIGDMKERLYQAERLSSLGKLAAGVAHEIRNPLNAVGMAVQRIQREFEPSASQGKKEFSHIVSVIRKEIGRLNGIIEDFLGPSRVKREEFQPRRLADFLQQVVDLVGEEAVSRNIRIEYRCQEPDLKTPMDPARLHQAVLNLMKNAVEAINGPGTITVSVRAIDARHAGITIQDSGPGISKDVLEKIFNYEYTTKEKGLGIGLPIANEIIRAHGGELRIESAPGTGALVEIILPARVEK